MNVIVLEQVLDDLRDAIDYFEEQSDGLGLRFRQCFQTSLEGIIEFPRICAVVRKGYRIRQIVRYRKFGILYRIKHRCIFIHGIIHLQRGPRFWRDRLR